MAFEPAFKLRALKRIDIVADQASKVLWRLSIVRIKQKLWPLAFRARLTPRISHGRARFIFLWGWIVSLSSQERIGDRSLLQEIKRLPRGFSRPVRVNALCNRWAVNTG